jgi:hypothetical protein
MENCKDFYEFQVKRNSTRLSRGLLVLLEDLQAQQRMNQDKLFLVIPAEYHNYIKLAAVLTDDQMRHLRKRILDNSNDYAREILSDLGNYQIEFNFKKEKE